MISLNHYKLIDFKNVNQLKNYVIENNEYNENKSLINATSFSYEIDIKTLQYFIISY
jgi:hypothetical protein